jgi:hypothetical protein
VPSVEPLYCPTPEPCRAHRRRVRRRAASPRAKAANRSNRPDCHVGLPFTATSAFADREWPSAGRAAWLIVSGVSVVVARQCPRTVRASSGKWLISVAAMFRTDVQRDGQLRKCDRDGRRRMRVLRNDPQRCRLQRSITACPPPTRSTWHDLNCLLRRPYRPKSAAPRRASLQQRTVEPRQFNQAPDAATARLCSQISRPPSPPIASTNTSTSCAHHNRLISPALS